ncbi:hypothetical protein FOL47_003880, partial [Perkinsus chesapeaki]
FDCNLLRHFYGYEFPRGVMYKSLWSFWWLSAITTSVTLNDIMPHSDWNSRDVNGDGNYTMPRGHCRWVHIGKSISGCTCPKGTYPYCDGAKSEDWWNPPECLCTVPCGVKTDCPRTSEGDAYCHRGSCLVGCS